MSLLDDLGVQGLPTISLTGFFSSTWIYVAIVAAIGFILLIIAGIMFFYMTYKIKVVLFENIAGQGFLPIKKTRARVLKITRTGTDNILKTLAGGIFLNAYGRKMGHNTYWFVKGQDGFFYNFILGDFDAKRGMLDIEPIDRDIRGWQTQLDRRTIEIHGKSDTMTKIIMYSTVFIFLIILVLGMWFLIGKIGEATAPLGQAQEQSLRIQEANQKTTQMLESLVRALGYEVEKLNQTPSSGLVPANG